MIYGVGTLLNINGLQGKVIGYIEYQNPGDGGKSWVEYRLKTNQGECWLSMDDFYKEYSISWPANDVRGQIGPEWHKVDEGTQVVRSFGGDVDVDPGERASFVEYEDATEDHTLSVEMWSDGVEYSRGEYVERSQIIETGYEKPKPQNKPAGIIFLVMFVMMFCLPMCSTTCSTLCSGASGSAMSKYIDKSPYYTYKTSITGNEKQEAKVYEYYMKNATTDTVAKDIIDAIEGNTECVTQKDDTENEDIAIMTKKEYCLIYHPESEEDVVYVQISSRKYNYTSDNAPYRSSIASTTWYRSHYYSAGYHRDSSSYKSTPSAYTMYQGSTVHNIGNGYFDSYSNSVKQSSINSRKSSSGGISSGK